MSIKGIYKISACPKVKWQHLLFCLQRQKSNKKTPLPPASLRATGHSLLSDSSGWCPQSSRAGELSGKVSVRRFPAIYAGSPFVVRK